MLDAVRHAGLAMERDAEEIAEELAEAIHAEAPELPDDPQSRAFTRRAAEESARRFAGIVSRGTPVAAESPVKSIISARAIARAGLDTRPVMRLVHISHRVFLAALEERLGELELETPVLLAALRACQQVTFDGADATTTELIAEYQDERDRLLRTGQAERARMIRALLDGEPLNPDAVSRTLGYELARHHTALILWAPDEDAGGKLDRTATEVAAAIGASKPLVLPVARTMAWAWLATHGPTTSAIASLRRQRSDGVSVALGETAAGVAGFRASHQDAEIAFRMAQLAAARPGAVINYPDVQLAAIFSTDIERARRFVRSRLGALATDDEEHLRLRATLKVYLDEHGSRLAAAERIGIHANTVSNRIRTCQEILGGSLTSQPVQVHVALALAERLGSAVLA